MVEPMLVVSWRPKSPFQEGPTPLDPSMEWQALQPRFWYRRAPNCSGVLPLPGSEALASHSWYASGSTTLTAVHMYEWLVPQYWVHSTGNTPVRVAWNQRACQR